MRKLLLTLVICIMLFSSIRVYSEEKIPINDKPSVLDIGMLAGAGISALAIELGKNYIGPFHPYWTGQNVLDVSMREMIVWNSNSLKTATTVSDVTILLLASQVAWIPLFMKAPYLNGVFVLSESLIYTFLISDVIKMVSGRQRPYSYYGTMASKGVDDNYSFISGHASMAFAMATTGSLLLADQFPELKILIYTLSFLAAGATAYFRMAGDQHYFTDVLSGAALGAGMGYLFYAWRKPWIQIQSTADGGIMIQKSIYF
ncbi:MAG: phosphatase PAP2 family protein [Spirochaetia bacterium]|nr:phosphatase PAP2 family protein [Spirochaetia bacterium]